MPNLIIESPSTLRKWTAGRLAILKKWEGKVTHGCITNGAAEDLRDAELRALEKELFPNG